MSVVLIDSSVLLDLVLCYQQKQRRNRSVASSVAAAVECLLFYDGPIVESPSSSELVRKAEAIRYLEFYCDNANLAVEQLNDLLRICKPLEVSEGTQLKCYEQSLEQLDNYLERIPDPDDLRAYEIYDFLPYHLGEDPTSIECQINVTSASELGELASGVPDYLRATIKRLEFILREKLHPVRAAWALPLLRLVYYQTLQQIIGALFVPHATKSTIGFGRETQTIRSKRLIDYCIDAARQDFIGRVESTCGKEVIRLSVPNIAEAILARSTEWTQLLDMILRLRESPPLQHFRSILASVLNSSGGHSNTDELVGLVKDIHQALEIQSQPRHVTVSLPFFDLQNPDDVQRTSSESQDASAPLVLIHQLYQKTD